MIEKIKHFDKTIVLQKTKTATKWLEWKLLMVSSLTIACLNEITANNMHFKISLVVDKIS